jgi:hypothetical protein
VRHLGKGMDDEKKQENLGGKAKMSLKGRVKEGRDA